MVPVVAVPAGDKGVVVAGGEACVVEDQEGFGAARGGFKVNDGVEAGFPVGGVPMTLR
jgi:hypothetical protein